MLEERELELDVLEERELELEVELEARELVDDVGVTLVLDPPQVNGRGPGIT